MAPCLNLAVPPATTASVTLTESDMGDTVSKMCRAKAPGAKAGALLHPLSARLGERVLRCPGQEGAKVKIKEALRTKVALGCTLGSLAMCSSEILSCLWALLLITLTQVPHFQLLRCIKRKLKIYWFPNTAFPCKQWRQRQAGCNAVVNRVTSPRDGEGTRPNAPGPVAI